MAAWLGLGLFDAIQTVFVMHSEGMHHVWSTVFLETLASWIPWAVATPFVVRLGRRLPPVAPRPFGTWLAHIAACVAIAVCFAAWSAALQILTNPFSEPRQSSFSVLWFDGFASSLLSSVVLYSVILVVSYAVDSRERLAFERTETARLSEQLSQAQLDALRNQIEPHFLFNALNAVAGLARAGRVDDAVRTIAELSDFLRRTLDDVARDHVTLSDEIAFARSYLNIQRVRFADRLEVRFDVPEDLERAHVPSLILQPLVENAVKHGIARSIRGGTIAIAVSDSADTLTVRISNDGPPLRAAWREDAGGIGLANVRARLETLYGDAFSLDLRDRAAGGVEAMLSLPLHRT